MELMEAVRDLSKEDFLRLLLVIYEMGASERNIIDTTENRLRRIKVRTEEWLEI